MPFLGHGACIGIGFESTWGTEVARSNWVRVVSHAIVRNIEKVPRPHLGTLGAVSYVRRSHYTQSDMVSGTVEILAAYNDSTVGLMAHALGAAADAGGPTYTHTLTVAQPGLVGLTLEAINGTGLAEVWEGCKIGRAELSIASGEIARFRLDVIGETNSGLEAVGTPAFATEDHILHSHAGQLGFNSASYDCLSFSIVCDRKIGTRQLLGSALTKEPLTSDFPEVSGSFVVEYSASTLNAAFIADTVGDLTISFTGTGANQLAITAHNIYIESVVRDVSGPGVIRETVTWKAQADGSDSGLAMVFTNANALYTTPGT